MCASLKLFIAPKKFISALRISESCDRRLDSLFGNGHNIHKRQFCSYTWRSHNCGELRIDHVGQSVTLCGWIQYQRMGKFVTLRDGYGPVQLISRDDDWTLGKILNDLPLESVVLVEGKVCERPYGRHNPKMLTGDIEVLMEKIQVLSYCKPNLPFNIRDFQKVHEPLRLQYRYLDLRRSKLQENLRFRSKFLMKIREFLCSKQGFVDIETPTLFKRTPGGAQEFIVPTQFPGKCYSLTQSPQQFKQLLMVGGFDKYFQIAKCYRDESTTPHRQPEFTQIDIEMSFCKADHVRKLIEDMLKYIWPCDLDVPFVTLTYHEAMQRYGTDKPDVRYDMKLQSVRHLFGESGVSIIDKALAQPDSAVCAIVVPDGSIHIKKNDIESFQEISKNQFGLEGVLPIYVQSDLSWKSTISKRVIQALQETINKELNSEPNSLILLSSGPMEKVYKSLGKIRERVASKLMESEVQLFSGPKFQFLWVVDFPLFVQKVGGGLDTAHHPFTAPHPEDVEYIRTDPLRVRSQQYDLVLNGEEIGGGSIRIHDSALQSYILETILQVDAENLQHLLDALASGCPPHGGIAIGLDRLLRIICGGNSIRDVIAFPKSFDGKDLMSGAPALITELERNLYHLSIKERV